MSRYFLIVNDVLTMRKFSPSANASALRELTTAPYRPAARTFSGTVRVLVPTIDATLLLGIPSLYDNDVRYLSESGGAVIQTKNGHRTALVTNATTYVGPPAVQALLDRDVRVLCQDESFSDREAAAAFERAHPGCEVTSSTEPDDLVQEMLSRFGRIDVLISNDVPRGLTSIESSGDPLHDLQPYVDSLLLVPAKLVSATLESMKRERLGSIVLVTSGAPLRNPMQSTAAGSTLAVGYSVARAATNALARAVAADVAEFNIQVNAIAPFYVFSPVFWPSELGEKDPEYMDEIKRMVPMGRFGSPTEVGALIGALTSGEMQFVSGQVIAFSGAGC